MPEVRLIDANALLKECENKGNFYSRIVREFLLTAPTVDAAPVRHGHWETVNPLYSNVYCSECGAAADKYLAKRYKGCPFCLCVMDATDTLHAAFLIPEQPKLRLPKEGDSDA